ncbi:thaumatin family protein [Desulfovibrio sp. JC010]|uniref:thaumatin family protein n=1 Tax=Desulfovibrio sp. JC010 TaxID=2593641 RepID=UPI0013D42B30|nr:thaumatin family protein [Desulfovibrio sp. JC010]NDV27651.1 thaumatin family protein [Desulfovibrio sp. JC010]
MSPKSGYTGIVMALGACSPSATNTVTYYFVNGTTASEAFKVDNTGNAGAKTYYMKKGLWKVGMVNSNYNQTLTAYINITDTGWTFAKGCSQTDPHPMPYCSAANLFPSPGNNLSPSCQGQKYTPPPAPSGTPSQYWSMTKFSNSTGITMAAGGCSVNSTDATITATYSVVNGNSTAQQFTINNKDNRSMMVYMKQNVLWKVDIENNYFKQKLSTYVKTTSSGWEYANNCTANSKTPRCSASTLLSPTSTTPPTINPGCQKNKYTPPPPPPVICGDNTTKTGWDAKRITITNNCADDAYIVITPPTAKKDYEKPNLKLWKMVAQNASMQEMYANPNDLSSALMFRKKLDSGKTMYLAAPKGGIASGNIGVLLNCQQDPTGIGWPGNCTMGAVPGTPSTGVGTILEYSAGCTYTSEKDRKDKCTINPSSKLNQCLDGSDYYDLSMVNGYSVPMSVKISTDKKYECNVTEINGVADLYDCPRESDKTISANGTYVKPYNNPQLTQPNGIGLHISNNAAVEGRAACITPAQWLNAGGQHPKNTQTVALGKNPVELNELTIADWYACNGIPKGQDSGIPAECQGPGCGGPQCSVGPDGEIASYNEDNLIRGKGIPYTNYVKYLKHIGVDAYAWQFNDDASTLLCKKAGVPIHLTLCPGPEGIKPYQKPYKKQTWTFYDNQCLPAKDKSGKYKTLLDCMQQHYSYTCQQEEVKKIGPKGTVYSAKLNYCKPYRVLNTQGQNGLLGDQSPEEEGVVPMSYQDCIKQEAQCQQFGPAN